MNELLAGSFLGNPLQRWAIATAIAFGVWALLAATKHLVVSRLSKVAQSTATILDDVAVEVVRGTKTLTLIAAGLAAGAAFALRLTAEHQLILERAFGIVVAVQFGMWITQAVYLIFETRRKRDSKLGPEPPGAATMNAAIGFVTRLVVWSLILVLVLSNLGIEVSTLIAGLGIGGLATALAVQNVLGDLFAAFSIYVDRPFDLGDFVIVDGFMGTVERIGWRSTQLRSLSGEQIILANSDLSRARIRNYKRMTERRVVLSFGVQYSTPTEKLARISSMVKEEVEGIEQLRFDRCNLSAMADSSLSFELVYYVLNPDFNDHMMRQEKVLIGIHRRLREESIELAFPTRTLHVYQHVATREDAAVDAG